MTARILDGKATAAAIREDLTRRVAELARRGITPGLGTVLVGDDPGSRSYVNGKHRDSVQVGIASIRRELPATATQAEVEEGADEIPDAIHFPGTERTEESKLLDPGLGTRPAVDLATEDQGHAGSAEVALEPGDAG